MDSEFYFDQADVPIALLTYSLASDEILVSEEYDNNSDSSHRASILAEDFSDTFEYGGLPESYNRKFKPLTNVIDAGAPIDVFEDLQDNTDFDRYAIFFDSPLDINPDHVLADLESSQLSMSGEVADYLDESDFYVLVNPIPVKQLLENKSDSYDFLTENNIPMVPGMDDSEVISRGRENVEAQIGSAGHWVTKPTNGGQGEEVRTFENFQDAKEQLENNDEPYRLEYFVDHDSDFRIKLIGDSEVAVEQRFGKQEDFRTNLSLLEGSIDEKVQKGLREGSVRAVEVPDQTDELYLTEKPDAQIAQSVHRVGEDIRDAFREYRSENSPVLNLSLAADVSLIDKEIIEEWPREHKERAMEYEADGKVPVVFEVNDIGGDIIDGVHYQEYPGNMPILKEIELLNEIVGQDIDQFGGLHESLTPEWRRVEVTHGGKWPSEVIAEENRIDESIDDEFMDRLQDMLE